MSNSCMYSCEGEACWWTIHPASKQRSEGEKVRIGDDLILVSVSTERYLVSHIHFFTAVEINKQNLCLCYFYILLLFKSFTPAVDFTRTAPLMKPGSNMKSHI